MTINYHRIREYLETSEFGPLLINELGWDYHTQRLNVVVDETEYLLTAVAEKRGLVVFCNSAPTEDDIPDYATRRKIERQVAKSVREHLIIYTDDEKSTQIWQWVKRAVAKPDACREHRYWVDQPANSLIEKLAQIKVSLNDEEAGFTLVDQLGNVQSAFDVERITKKFYVRFKVEHEVFLKFLREMPDEAMQRWYASIILNRLMFIYFIQKKGFLNDDANYLRTKLAESKVGGTDRYYTAFLCPLFFEGFAKPESERNTETRRLLGNVPYLNGGIFQRHQIEEHQGEPIQIPDTAFERLLNFFERYQWRLDDRPRQNDSEINPDVLGYIFEKYINQKQMGAYYTKEDITGYISKNTIIPFLLDAARENCKIAFTPPVGSDAASGTSATVWQLLVDNPDRYIYDAVKHGVEHDLPSEIAIGINEVSTRTMWNSHAPDEYALPTEIWREVVARRARYNEIHTKLSNGKIHEVNNLITYNLNIRQFAQDIIENCEGPELLRAFWSAITQVTVLDPTCGSGAFLFAALNILEPLYEACLDRMQVFLDELPNTGESPHSKKYADFREILDRVDEHANRKYFILKSIIINNLYGVDIMDEAVEICKLRLFLKIVAQIEDINDIEPLPDIDFNIQAGNTLVGYATYDEVEKAVTGKLDFDNTIARIKESAEVVERLFKQFRQQQTELRGSATPGNKQMLQDKLRALEDELNRYLAGEYNVDPSNESEYRNWLSSHKPFHWFIEFYGILKNGGFDAIIGNPPYVNLKKIGYSIQDYDTMDCGDLFPLCCERSASLNHRYGSFAMIIPLSGYSTKAMRSLRTLLLESYSENHLSYFSASDQPASLFTGVRHRLMIFVNRRSSCRVVSATRFLKWFRAERDVLFTSIVKSHTIGTDANLPLNSKVSSDIEESILKKILQKPMLARWRRRNGHKDSAVYYHDAPVHWGKVFDFIPFFKVGNTAPTRSSHIKCLYFESSVVSQVVLCFLNSSHFYWWNWHFTNCRDLSIYDIDCSRIDISSFTDASIEDFLILSTTLMEDLKRNSKIYRRVYRGTLTQFDSFYPALSKPIIDEIDRLLAQHYGLSDEELDFIINYDIKYRMGLGHK